MSSGAAQDPGWLAPEVVDPVTELAACQPSDEEAGAFGELLAESFSFITPATGRRWVLGCDFARVVKEAPGDGDGGTVLGGFAMIRQGLFYGGASVPCNGVTAVGVRSERRGEGVAGAALRVCLQDALAMGVPLLSLHPTSDAVYRRFGWERAGHVYQHTVATGTLRVSARDAARATRADPDASAAARGVGSQSGGKAYRLREFDPTRDEAAVKRMYARHARRVNGMVDRGDYVWRRVFFENPRGDPSLARNRGFVVERAAPRKPRRTTSAAGPSGGTSGADSGAGSGAGAGAAGTTDAERGDGIDGYVFVHMSRAGGLRFECAEVKSVWCTTPGAWLAVARYLHGLRSTCDKVKWSGAASHPLHHLINGQWGDVKVNVGYTAWVRVVDVAGALRARGYPRWLRTSAVFKVIDDVDVTSHNNGWYHVAVANGAATVKHAAEAAATPVPATWPRPVMDVRGLAALFTGHSTPSALCSAGLLWRATGPGIAGASGDGEGTTPGSGPACASVDGDRGGLEEDSGEERWGASLAALQAMFCSDGQPTAEDIY